MNRITTQLKEFWNKLSMIQRFTVSFLVLFFIMGAVFLGTLFIGHDYTELAKNLDPEDAGAMVDILEERGIPYSLEDGGSTIKVPENEHSRIRLTMAEEGLPRHGVFGYEDLEDTPLGLTESERRLRQRVALEGELVRTIRMYPEIENARVHIVTPEDTLFRRDEREATAAVYLEVPGRQELGDEQVKSIINLVAHSVENLPSENVTITSGSRVLSDDVRDASPRDDARGEVRKQLQIESEFQNTLQQNAQSMLQEVLGSGNSIVRVSANLDFDEVQSVSELFEPVDEEEGEGILVSMHEVSEFFEGSGPPPGGVVGDPAVDTPEYPAEDMKQESLYERDEVTKNYEVNRIVEEYKHASGNIEGISVSVALDEANLLELIATDDQIEEAEEDDEVELIDLVDEAEVDAMVESIESMIVNGLGLQILDNDEDVEVAGLGEGERDDSISVETITNFDRTLEEQWEEERARVEAAERRQMIIQAAIVIVALIVAFIVGRRLYRGYTRRQQEEQLREEQVAQQEMAAEEMPEPEESEARKQISDLAKNKPEEFVKVLRTWLSEE